mgnify:CR=1 FL=1
MGFTTRSFFRSLFVALLFSFFLAALAGCEQEPPLVKKWRLEEVELGKELSPDMQAEFDRNKEKVTITFYEDGRFESTLDYLVGSKEKQQGEWELKGTEEEGQVLITRLEGQTTGRRFRVIELTEDRLVLSPDNQWKMVLVPASS